MAITDIANSAPLAGIFLQPMLALLPGARHQRRCPEISDRDWMILGTARTIEAEPSGRAFLQKSGTLFTAAPLRSSFFEALASKRRSRLTKEVNEALAKSMSRLLPEPFSAFPQLAPFDLYAGDGHFHSAAIHDPRDACGTRHATGHVYLLNLRSQAMRHLDLCDPVTRKKEQDMHVIKRHHFAELRGHAPRGRKVILTWDRAALDFALWQKAKDTAGLYFVSRPKSNTSLMRCAIRVVADDDPVNAGIVSDDEGAPAATAKVIRLITWVDPDSGTRWQFLTNEMTLAPGLIVLIYRRRWDIEKVFDEFKNKLCEKRSWASSAAARRRRLRRPTSCA